MTLKYLKCRFFLTSKISQLGGASRPPWPPAAGGSAPDTRLLSTLFTNSSGEDDAIAQVRKMHIDLVPLEENTASLKLSPLWELTAVVRSTCLQKKIELSVCP